MEALQIPKGTRYGSWKIVEELAADRRGNRQFLCQCVCGSRVSVLLMNLRRGKTRGCVNCCSVRGIRGRPRKNQVHEAVLPLARKIKKQKLKDAGII